MTVPPVTPGASALYAVLSTTLHHVRGSAVRLEGWTVDTAFARHSKQRAVRYDLQVRAEGAPVAERCAWVGKVYDREEDGRRVAGVLHGLARGDCGARGSLVVPRVLAYDASHRLLLVTYEHGESVSSAIEHDAAAVLAGMGRGLAALHAAPVSVEAVLSPTVVLDDLRARMGELALRLPALVDDLQRAFRHLAGAVPPLPAAQRFVHGDFSPANLLWRAGELVVLGFDKCRRGDPAADLGKLLAHLRRMTVRKPDKLRDFAAARRDVLSAYRQWSAPDPALDRRVAWYERATLLRKVHRVALAATPPPEEAIRLLRICASYAAARG
jgi:aminoglycoside phosphotransferase (APT) family kinase protein